VGHPLLDSPNNPTPRPETEDANGPVLGLAPGSRDREVAQLLPIMLKAAAGLKKKIPDLEILTSLASSLDRKFIDEIIERNCGDLEIQVVEGGAKNTFERSTLLLAASGTVTLEAALAGVPMVIIYKVSPLSYRLGKALIRVKYASLVNLIARKELLPELLQEKAAPEHILPVLENMFKDRKKLALLRKRLLQIRRVFGGPGASERVADIALEMMV
jgi:lipid-A-disaccharide synthase